MKNKKGFTLIELLAVIVILAIIALIATPIILNMIDNAKKNAAKDSAYGYIQAIEYQNSSSILDESKKIADGIYEVYELKDISLKGKKPLYGQITIKKSAVEEAHLCIDGYLIDYENGVATVNGQCNKKTEGNETIILITNEKATTNSFEIEFAATDSVGIKETNCYYSEDTEYKNKGTISNNKCIVTGLENNKNYNYKIEVLNKMGTVTEKTGVIKTINFETITITTDPADWASSKTVTITGKNESNTLYYQVGETVDETKWIEYTEPFTLEENTNIYAKLTDGKNMSDAKVFQENKIDTTKPELTLGTITTSTSRIIIPITKNEDLESDINETTCVYGTSTSYGNNGTLNSDNTACTLSNLTSGTTYYYKITTTNNAGLTTEVIGSKMVGTTEITFALNPSDNSSAASVTVTPTFTTTNVTTKTYYIKTTVATTVSENVYACGNSTDPGICSTTATTSMNANYWYKTTTNKPVITFTDNGSIFALINDGDNYLTAKTISIANIVKTASEIYYNNSTYTNGQDITVQQALEELYELYE